MREAMVTRRRLLGAGAAAAAMSASAGGLGSGFGGARAAEAPLSALRAIYEEDVALGRIAGACAALGRMGEAPRFVAAGRLGLGSGPAMAPDTLMRLYSMTKPLTAMLALALIEEGRLGLDQPIADLAPEFSAPKVLEDAAAMTTRPAARPITVRHLLTHTSGLIYHYNQSGPPALQARYRRAGIVPGARGLMRPEDGDLPEPTSLDAFAARLAELPLADDPGASWRYGVSTDLLGLVAQRAAQAPFERALRERLLDPLGMTDTDWVVAPEKAARLADNHALIDDVVTPVDRGASSVYLAPPPFPGGGAGLVSSAADYARFAAMLANEGRLGRKRILRERTVRRARANLLPPGVLAEGHFFGAGMRVARVGVPTTPGQSPGAYGWSGAAGTDMWIDPAQGFYFVHMVQLIPWSAHGLLARAGAAAALDAKQAGRAI